MERKISVLPTAIKLFQLLQKNDRKFLILSVAICALSGLASSSIVLIKQRFFEAVEELPYGTGIQLAMGLGLFWAVFTVITLIVQAVSDILIEDLGIRIGGRIGKSVNEKAAKIPPISYETTEILDCINKAYQGVEQSADAIKLMVMLCSYYIPYFVFFAIYSYFISPVLCLGVFVILVPTVVGQYVRSHYYTAFEDTVAPIRRKMIYYRSCITEREYVKETRLLGAVYFFRNLYETSLLLFKKESWKTERKSAILELGLRLCSLAAYVVILAVMYQSLRRGVMGTAAFVAILTSLDQSFNYMDYVGYNIGEISVSMPALINSIHFLNLPEKDGVEVSLEHNAVDIRQVSFKYPGSEKYALHNVNVHIEEGETIAVVGGNGSGKSTFTKLVLGLYMPTDGDIFVGGYNTKEVTSNSIFKNNSAVFQNFQKYKMMLKDNISISNVKQNADDQTFSDIMRSVDLEDNEVLFPEGLDTMLAKEYGGTDLSGGQWQRVAIGRGLYRSHDLIVLDEPTAAIDPVEESKLYRQFAEIAKNKTALIVTHRLGSAKIADRILVLDNGCLDDIGTHEELMARKGRYKEMYDAQAKWYET
jgi:ATP-binding cassette subfamily B protein